MNDQQITALAHEYAEEIYEGDTDFIDEAENVLTWLLRRYCLVEKSKLQELEIARRAKEHGAVWLNQWEAEYLFPEIGKEVEK